MLCELKGIRIKNTLRRKVSFVHFLDVPSIVEVFEVFETLW